MAGLWPAVLVLGYVTLQRLGELAIARANTRRLLANGAIEVGAPHYPLIVALHAAWLATLWVLAPGRPILLLPLVLFVLVFSALNALILAIRIPAEAKALAEHAHRVQAAGGPARRSA